MWKNMSEKGRNYLTCSEKPYGFYYDFFVDFVTAAQLRNGGEDHTKEVS
jgi:hypothetical protein